MKKIFVSSTFKDMQYERNYLHEYVVPRLNAAAADYGESVSLTDLRWGVNTSQMDQKESSRKVLSVCIQEIDHCRPYMIVILGERYGWIPDHAMIRTTNVPEGPDTWGDAIDALDVSVTELEIRHGVALREREELKILFYYRHMKGEKIPSDYLAEDRYHAEKLENLKNRIRKLPGVFLKEYTLCWNEEKQEPDGLSQFGEMVRQDVMALMENEWKEILNLSPWEKCALQQNALCGEKSAFAVERSAMMQKIEENIREKHALILKGDEGCGKSVSGALWSARCEANGRAVLRFFCGTSPLLSTAESLVRGMIWHLENLACSTHEETREMNEEDLISRLEECCALCAREGSKPVSILIDGIDRLLKTTMRDQYDFIPANVSEKVQVLVTTTLAYQIPLNLPVVIMGTLTEPEKADMIRSILKGAGKELDERIVSAIIKRRVANNPLSLELLMKRFLLMGKEDYTKIRNLGDNMEAIYSFQSSLLNGLPDTPGMLFLNLIVHAEKNQGYSWIHTVCSMIAFSRSGLRYSDLRAAIGDGLTQLDFAVFTNYLSGCFIIREDGRYDLSHRILKSVFIQLFHETDKNQVLYLTINRQIADHLIRLPEYDEIRRSEYLWHTMQGDLRKAALAYIGSVMPDSAMGGDGSKTGAGLRDDAEKQASQKTALCAACEAALAAAMTDSGRWFCECFVKWGRGETFCPPETILKGMAFFVGELPAQCGRTFQEMMILGNIARAVIWVLEKRFHVTEEGALQTNRHAVYLHGRACLALAYAEYQTGMKGSIETRADENGEKDGDGRTVEYAAAACEILEAAGAESSLLIHGLQLYGDLLREKGLYQGAFAKYEKIRKLVLSMTGERDPFTGRYKGVSLEEGVQLQTAYIQPEMELALSIGTAKSINDGIRLGADFLEEISMLSGMYDVQGGSRENHNREQIEPLTKNIETARLEISFLYIRLLNASEDEGCHLLAEQTAQELMERITMKLQKKNDSILLELLEEINTILAEEKNTHGDYKSVSDGVKYASASVHMGILRAGFLQTPKAAFSLIHNLLLLSRLYAGHGTAAEAEYARKLFDSAERFLQIQEKYGQASLAVRSREEVENTRRIIHTKQTLVQRTSDGVLLAREDVEKGIKNVAEAKQVVKDEMIRLWERRFRNNAGDEERWIELYRLEAWLLQREGAYEDSLEPAERAFEHAYIAMEANISGERLYRVTETCLEKADAERMAGQIKNTLDHSGDGAGFYIKALKSYDRGFSFYRKLLELYPDSSRFAGYLLKLCGCAGFYVSQSAEERMEYKYGRNRKIVGRDEQIAEMIEDALRLYYVYACQKASKALFEECAGLAVSAEKQILSLSIYNALQAVSRLVYVTVEAFGQMKWSVSRELSEFALSKTGEQMDILRGVPERQDKAEEIRVRRLITSELLKCQRIRAGFACDEDTKLSLLQECAAMSWELRSVLAPGYHIYENEWKKDVDRLLSFSDSSQNLSGQHRIEALLSCGFDKSMADTMLPRLEAAYTQALAMETNDNPGAAGRRKDNSRTVMLSDRVRESLLNAYQSLGRIKYAKQIRRLKKQ